MVLQLSSFKAVFFDVGGTLIRVHPSVGDIYAKHARDFGFTGTADQLNKGFRLHWKKMGGIESLGNQSGARVEKKFWIDLVFEVFKPLGGLDRFDEYFKIIFEGFLFNLYSIFPAGPQTIFPTIFKIALNDFFAP